MASTATVEYGHSLGETVTAALDAGLRLEALREHTEADFDPRGGMLEPEADGRFRLRVSGELLPVLFTLVATEALMRIAALETLRKATQPNLLVLRLRTDDGLVGLGESFFGARAVEAYLHETAAPVLLGADDPAPERMARLLPGHVGFQGSGAETRGNGAIDLALWDLLGQQAGTARQRAARRPRAARAARLQHVRRRVATCRTSRARPCRTGACPPAGRPGATRTSTRSSIAPTCSPASCTTRASGR